MPLLPEERAEDLRERFVHLLNDAWAVEKEQVGLLQALADECEEPDVRGMLEEDRAACQRRQEEVEGRLEGLGAHPAGGRGMLGQLVTRIWEAVQAPRDPADRAVLVLLKAVSAAEFQAGLYAAAHACARAVGGEETAQHLADYYRQERGRADRLRAVLTPTVARAARR
jgi:ferritin-like metal-binding protein YciE